MDNTLLHNFIMNYFADKDLPIEEITLIGIRDSKDQEKDVINDYLGFITEKELFLCKGTTEPGVYWVKNKVERNKKGTFHLLEGFHEKIWSIGTHKGYEALTNQYPQCKPTKGWRDANYDFTRDNKDIIVCDYFGINFHRMHPVSIVDKIGKYSAGCQVVQNAKDLAYVLTNIKNSLAYKKDKKATFNYMLFTVDQLPMD
jgi:hypothetical protein